MDQFVDQLRAEGTQESEGVFTMAVEKASWKLAAYRLAVPESYPLHVVAAAVAGNASSLSITRQAASVRFVFDGQAYEQADLSLLSQPALGEGTPRRVRQLAIAVSAGSAVGRLRFSSVGPKGAGYQLKVAGEDVALSALEPGDATGVARRSLQVLEVDSALSDVAVEILKARCHFAPLDLTVDGASLRGPVDFGIFERDYYGYYLLPGQTDLVVRSPNLSQRRFFRWTGSARPGEPTVTLALTSFKRAKQHGFSLLSDGIAHRLSIDELPDLPPFLCGAVCANHLKKDISQADYVRNAEYEKLLRLLSQCAVDFLERFCAKPTPLPEAMREDFRYHLARLPEGSTQPAIQKFIHQGATVARLTDGATLHAIGQSYRDGDSVAYLEKRRALRAELARVRKGGKGQYPASELLEAEALLHQAAGLTDPDFEQLRAAWLTLRPGPGTSDQEASEAQTWAGRTLADPQASPVSRYRAGLILLGRMSRPEIAAWVTGLEIAPEWTALMRYALLASDSQPQSEPQDWGRLETPLLALALAREGKMSRSWQTFLQLSEQRLQHRWLEVGATLTKRGLDLREYFGQIARLNIAFATDTRRNDWSVYRGWLGNLSLQLLREQPLNVFLRRQFEPSLLPLLLLRLHISESLEEALALVGPVLLQHSLGPADSPLLELDQLPEQPAFVRSALG